MNAFTWTSMSRRAPRPRRRVTLAVEAVEHRLALSTTLLSSAAPMVSYYPPHPAVQQVVSAYPPHPTGGNQIIIDFPPHPTGGQVVSD